MLYLVAIQIMALFIPLSLVTIFADIIALLLSLGVIAIFRRVISAWSPFHVLTGFILVLTLPASQALLGVDGFLAAIIVNVPIPRP